MQKLFQHLALTFLKTWNRVYKFWVRAELQDDLFRPTGHCALLQLHDMMSIISAWLVNDHLITKTALNAFIDWSALWAMALYCTWTKKSSLSLQSFVRKKEVSFHWHNAWFHSVINEDWFNYSLEEIAHCAKTMMSCRGVSACVDCCTPVPIVLSIYRIIKKYVNKKERERHLPGYCQ